MQGQRLDINLRFDRAIYVLSLETYAKEVDISLKQKWDNQRIPGRKSRWFFGKRRCRNAKT
jgi:hypothetical protein